MSDTNHKSGPQGRPVASGGEVRRENILESALNLFANQGIAATTIARIAEDAGVTSAMVHYYFSNREGLLDAIASERLGPAIRYIWEGVSDDNLADPRRMVTVFVDRLLETVERMPQIPFLWSREVLNAGGLLRERIMAFVPMERFAVLHEILGKAQQEGTLHPQIDPALLLTSIMAVVMLPLAARDTLNMIPAMPSLNRETIRRHALALLLDGLCPNKRQEERR